MFESVQYCEAQRNEGVGIKRAGEKVEPSVGGQERPCSEGRGSVASERGESKLGCPRGRESRVSREQFVKALGLGACCSDSPRAP